MDSGFGPSGRPGMTPVGFSAACQVLSGQAQPRIRGSKQPANQSDLSPRKCHCHRLWLNVLCIIKYLAAAQILKRASAGIGETRTGVARGSQPGLRQAEDELKIFLQGDFVMQSEQMAPLHVAIIMDGNGRWATRRGLPRSAGHRAGVQTVRRVVEAAPNLGITTLTLFAFSSDNWRRPAQEVSALMSLLRHYLRADLAELIENGVRLTVIGRKDRLGDDLAREIVKAEQASSAGTRIHLRVAVDYSSRDTIAAAAARWRPDHLPSREAFDRFLAGPEVPRDNDVDLLIRTGGEKRLSDFLLWESAYAELCFVDTLWPDFDAGGLRTAVAEFWRRDRRFGGTTRLAPLVAAE
jgi:undecaprenyl diphosphate synthase